MLTSSEGSFLSIKISFDLDDTLICVGNVQTEPCRVPRLLRYWYREPLRLGSCELFSELAHRNCETGIYTTSLRSKSYVRRWLRFYSICPSFVVNQQVHQQYCRKEQLQSPPSKNPKLFNIDLHIDDSHGVRLEGEQFGFNTLIIEPNDGDWMHKVLQKVDGMIKDSR